MKISSQADCRALIWWEDTVQRRAAECAVFDGEGTARATFAELEQQSTQLVESWERASKFSAASLRNNVCSFLCPPHPLWSAGLLALWKCGATVLLLPSVHGEPRARIEATAGAQWRLEGAENGEWRFQPLENARVEFPWRAELLKVTSGSTGQPRVIGFTAEQLRADAAQILEAMEITPQDRNFGVIPFSHSYGFSNLVTPLLFFGVPLVCAPDPLPRALAESLTKSRATVWPAVPAMFPSLLKTGFRARGGEGSRLRRVISAGAPLSATLARDFDRQTGLPVHSFYGSSECGGICFDREARASELEGWVGTPMPAVRVREIAADSGVQIEIVGKNVGLGYFPKSDDDLLLEGIFRPADVLQRVAGGYRIVGRADDVVNLGGRKVHPAEVEAALSKVKGIRAVVVCGVPGKRGEELLAWVEAEHAGEVSTLRVAAAELLPEWQIPRHWEFVDHIPWNERGKINRRDLARRWAGAQD